MAAYFSIILVIITSITGIIWLIDAQIFAPKRRAALTLLQAKNVPLTHDAINKLTREPILVEMAHGVFPVFAFVLVLRSFLYEPFQIPSGSMMPTLLVDDFILVEKFSYGLKDPVWRTQLVETGKPQRGDAIVFKYPEDPKMDYIKRVIGLPGDKVIYNNKELVITPACNNKENCPEAMVIDRVQVNRGEFSKSGVPLIRLREQLGDIQHHVLINPARPEASSHYFRQPGLNTGEFLVPQGMYFAMGDNRDDSTDSRFWGFVPEENLVGKAVAIWVSFEYQHGADSWIPAWIPSGVRFERIGAIS
ncbi:signal peptidase I. Serine peptidase. MEROPS family S26A [Shewanella denitrificans OS217]|uniref:Signal peptidase I n=1 Tax=Shewanella denitrificans (strain OS217 / ATCC BAA-1090 / DSM 15013) TaxID=318161 RepID=Q12LD4_SHEDO|nr:signal peptidase I [Shewanella denitrificans]ABE55742.1 signal peptidase I. Serine peptidase. MEROPS family S26A [Shewanella denitrificans OS217]